MRCPLCDQAIPENSGFCPRCGRELPRKSKGKLLWPLLALGALMVCGALAGGGALWPSPTPQVIEKLVTVEKLVVEKIAVGKQVTVVRISTATAVPTTRRVATATSCSDAIVSNPSLNLRSGPGDIYSIVANYSQGTAITVLGKAPGAQWLKVRTPDGRTGWMWTNLMKVNLSMSHISEVALPSSPLDGKLVKGTGDPVYLVERGQLRWFPNSNAFEAWAEPRGLGWESVVDYSGQPSRWAEICSLPWGEPMSYSYPIVNGTLVQAIGSAVYAIQTNASGQQYKERVVGAVDGNAVAYVSQGWLAGF